MEDVIIDEDSYTTGAVIHCFVRACEFGGLAIVASLGLAGRVRATYLHVDFAPAYAEHHNAGDYIDREWYYLLDNGQYYHLDRGQYNLMGGLSYQLGHPCYPKLFERDLDQAVGFTNKVNRGWLSFGGGQVPISEYAVWSYHFNAGDYIDRGRYFYLDKGRYYYLDEVQYSWLGGLGYSFGRPYYQRPSIWSPHQSVSISATPEPHTIVFLGLGALGVLGSRTYWEKRYGGKHV
ncbi:hypothetical protein ES703_39421 [subsurface metagenome]